MEAFSLLKFWRVIAEDEAAGGEGSSTDLTEGFDTAIDGGETDEEDSFFDLEFTVPGYDERKQNDDGNDGINRDEDSDNNLSKEIERIPQSEQNLGPQSPILFLRSPSSYRVFMLFKKPKLQKTAATDISSSSPATPKRHRKRKSLKCEVEDIPIFSLLAMENSSRRNSSKRFTKDLLSKYMKLIKPLYVRASKRYVDKLKSSDDISSSSPSPSPGKKTEEKQVSRKAPLRVVCKHFGKSRSASSTVGIMPPEKRKDDSLTQQHDGIQSAILHCKRSYNFSRELSTLSRSASDSSHEIFNPSKTSQ